MGELVLKAGVVASMAFAVVLGGCSSCDLFGGPTAIVRLEYGVDTEEIQRRRPDLQGADRAKVASSALEQSRDVVARRLEELDVRRAEVTIRGKRLVVDIPIRDEDDGELIPIVRRTVSREGRLEFRIADDRERAFYGRLGLIVQNDPTVELVPEKQSFFLRASDQRYQDGKVIKGTDAIRALLSRARDHRVDVPPNREILFENVTPSRSPQSFGPQMEQVWRSYLLHQETAITGELVHDARVVVEDSGPEEGWSWVSLEFNDRGRQRFGDVTAANVRKRLAIVVEDEVTSAPVIMEAIRGGHTRISLGGFNTPETVLEDARTLAIALRTGELPAPLVLLSETTIVPPSE